MNKQLTGLIIDTVGSTIVYYIISALLEAVTGVNTFNQYGIASIILVRLFSLRRKG